MNIYTPIFRALDDILRTDFIVEGSTELLVDDLPQFQALGRMDRAAFTMRIYGFRGLRIFWEFMASQPNRHIIVKTVSWTANEGVVVVDIANRQIRAETASYNLMDLCRGEAQALGFGIIITGPPVNANRMLQNSAQMQD
jgi:hypothetical protein